MKPKTLAEYGATHLGSNGYNPMTDLGQKEEGGTERAVPLADNEL